MIASTTRPLFGTETPASLARVASRGKWKMPRHLAYLNRKLMDAAAGRTKRLIITMPPRHGKSEITSRYYPAWYLGTYPDRRVMLTSYQGGFASTWGRKSRDILEEHGRSLFGVGICPDSSAADRWDIAGREGGMVTAGTGGASTGKGAHLLLIDDPIKNAEEALSASFREKCRDWFTSVAYTRLEPDAVCVLIQTRWAEDDLAGWLLKEAANGGEHWELINLPALAEPGDVLGRAEGEALWPERYDVARLLEIKRAVGSFWWNALYQQRPTPREGALFKRTWWVRYKWAGNHYRLVRDGSQIFPHKCRRIGVMDPAGGTSAGADHTAITFWDVTADRKAVLRHARRERVAVEDIPRLLKRECDEHRPLYVLVEGLFLQSSIVRECRRLQGMPPIRAVDPRGKTRAYALRLA